MTNEKRKPNPLADALREAVERVETAHTEVVEHDVQVLKRNKDARWSGVRPAEAMLVGSDYEPDRLAARTALRGMWSPCMRDAGGCGTSGVVGNPDGQGFVQCPICHGAGRIPSVAGLELLHFVLDAITPQPKPEATPEAIAERNRVIADRISRQEEIARMEHERAAENGRRAEQAQNAIQGRNATNPEVQS